MGREALRQNGHGHACHIQLLIGKREVGKGHGLGKAETETETTDLRDRGCMVPAVLGGGGGGKHQRYCAGSVGRAENQTKLSRLVLNEILYAQYAANPNEGKKCTSMGHIGTLVLHAE